MNKTFLIIMMISFWSTLSFAVNPEEAKKFCTDEGFEVGSEDFYECALQVMSKKSVNQDSGKKFILSKDCSHLKKLHKKLLCKTGSDMYDDDTSDISTEVKETKKDGFNKKYNSFADFLKLKKN